MNLAGACSSYTAIFLNALPTYQFRLWNISFQFAMQDALCGTPWQKSAFYVIQAKTNVTIAEYDGMLCSRQYGVDRIYTKDCKKYEKLGKFYSFPPPSLGKIPTTRCQWRNTGPARRTPGFDGRIVWEPVVYKNIDNAEHSFLCKSGALSRTRYRIDYVILHISALLPDNFMRSRAD
jgi:hypothetical protein